MRDDGGGISLQIPFVRQNRIARLPASGTGRRNLDVQMYFLDSSPRLDFCAVRRHHLNASDKSHRQKKTFCKIHMRDVPGSTETGSNQRGRACLLHPRSLRRPSKALWKT